MAKAPYFDFTIGDKSMDELGIQYLIKSMIFEEEIGKFCVIKMKIKSGPELSSAYYLLKHGGIFQLSMGYYNGLIKKMGLAFHVGVEPDFSQQTVTIEFADYLRAMSIGEKDRVLVGKTLQQAVAIVVADYAPLVMGSIDNGDVIISDTISQSKKTDFQLLQDIAKAFAMNWRLDATETPGIWSISLRETNFDDDPDQYETFYAYPDKEYQELTQNIHLKGFKPKSNILEDIPSRITIESNNPNQPLEVDSKLYSEELYVSEVRGSEVVFTVFGQVNRVQFHENVTDEEAAQIISDQMLQSEELKFVQAKNVQLSEGNAGVRIGQRRHVIPKGIPLFSKVFEGDYLVTKTKHQITTKTGYDTWVDLGRASLTIPPPPELSSSGGGGSPIIVWVTQSTVIRGQHVSFNAEGLIQYGANISAEEITSNDYWMSKIWGVTGPVVGSMGTVSSMIAGTQTFGASGAVPGTGTINDQTISLAAGVGFAPAQGVAIYIDFPDQWSTSPLADSVTQPSTIEPTSGGPTDYELEVYEFETQFGQNLQQTIAEAEVDAAAASLYKSGNE